MSWNLIYTNNVYLRYVGPIDRNQSSYILSNVQKGEMVKHVSNNIDRKNKNIKRTKTHHAHPVLVQNCDIAGYLSKINLGPKYPFDKKNQVLHRQALKCA